MTHDRQPSRRPRSSNEERAAVILDTARRLFVEQGVHAVGMDRLIKETGLSKMSVYRVYPTKDDLIGAYLADLAADVLGQVDADAERHGDDPAAALAAVLDAIESDLRRASFRGCPFGNAASEFADVDHPARRIASGYRRELLARLVTLATCLDPVDGPTLGRRVAVLVDGAYLSAAHLGWDGPASDGVALARELVAAARSRTGS